MAPRQPHDFIDVIADGDDDDALRRNTLRYRSLVQTFADFVWKTDAEGLLQNDLPMWREITGLSTEETLGMGWTLGIHPDDVDRATGAWSEAVRTRGIYRVTYRLVGPGGTRWLEIAGAPVIVDDTVIEWIGTAVDVTDAHMAAEAERTGRAALEAERELLFQVVARAPMAVAVVRGPEHRYELFNDHYAGLVPSGRVRVGTTLAEAVPEAASLAVPLLDRAFGGETVEYTERQVPFDGVEAFEGYRYYDGVYTPVVLSGVPTGVLIIATEVTEQVRRRDDLRRQLDTERTLAAQFQRALLPDAVDDVAGVSFAVKYLPATTGLGVGGDWYDVVDLGDGCAFVVMGDICGKGLQAATEMAQVRAAARAYAVQHPSPGSVLGELARFTTALALPDMITVAIGLLDVDAGVLRYASAGHPPPLLVSPGGEPAYVEHDGGPPLGGGAGTYREIEVALPPGSRLVLYTDGVVEERRRSLDVTMEELRVVATGPGRSAAELCEALARHALTGSPARDDAAILVCAL